jgi:hypothetical protein
VHRIIRHAFDFAAAHGRTRVCMADKSNAMAQGHALWQRVFREVAAEYPAIEATHLYIDALDAPPENTHPGIAECVVTQQTRYGFTVQFAGIPRFPGYFLRWRVIVIDLASTILIDAPEAFRVQLPMQARQMTVYFTNLRSNESYGFSELRVENLQDDPDTQRIILVQVTEKTTISFTIGINPRPENTHYFLVARTP